MKEIDEVKYYTEKDYQKLVNKYQQSHIVIAALLGFGILLVLIILYQAGCNGLICQ